jgi:Nucleotide-diphospho-sugar transferase
MWQLLLTFCYLCSFWDVVNCIDAYDLKPDVPFTIDAHEGDLSLWHTAHEVHDVCDYLESCSSHGECMANKGCSCTCRCFAGFSGYDCSIDQVVFNQTLMLAVARKASWNISVDVVVTLGDQYYLPWMDRSLSQLLAFGVRNILALCMDITCYNHISTRNVPVFLTTHGTKLWLEVLPESAGGGSWLRGGAVKTLFIREIIESGASLLWLDADIGFVRPPSDVLGFGSAYDIQASTAGLYSAKDIFQAQPNIGFLALKSNAAVKEFLKELHGLLLEGNQPNGTQRARSVCHKPSSLSGFVSGLCYDQYLFHLLLQRRVGTELYSRPSFYMISPLRIVSIASCVYYGCLHLPESTMAYHSTGNRITASVKAIRMFRFGLHEQVLNSANFLRIVFPRVEKLSIEGIELALNFFVEHARSHNRFLILPSFPCSLNPETSRLVRSSSCAVEVIFGADPLLNCKREIAFRTINDRATKQVYSICDGLAYEGYICRSKLTSISIEDLPGGNVTVLVHSMNSTSNFSSSNSCFQKLFANWL